MDWMPGPAWRAVARMATSTVLQTDLAETAVPASFQTVIRQQAQVSELGRLAEQGRLAELAPTKNFHRHFPHPNRLLTRALSSTLDSSDNEPVCPPPKREPSTSNDIRHTESTSTPLKSAATTETVTLKAETQQASTKSPRVSDRSSKRIDTSDTGSDQHSQPVDVAVFGKRGRQPRMTSSWGGISRGKRSREV